MAITACTSATEYKLYSGTTETILDDVLRYTPSPDVLGETTFTKGTILVIDNLHPLYSDIPHYYKNNIVKKL